MKGCGVRRRCGDRRGEPNCSRWRWRWASRRRQDLLELLDKLSQKIQELTRALEQEVGEATGGAATDDPSWGGAVDGAGVRTGHRNARTLWLRQTDRQLCGAGAVGGVQRGSATAGPHQQAR